MDVLILKRYYYGRTNVWMPRVKTKSFGWAANRNQPQHRLKFVVKIYIYIYMYVESVGEKP